MDEADRTLTLALGPTNTGKTHRAVERMLEHASGMIGLPLRLLAREVYDWISARIGEGQVALVTGEEKRVPRAPRYWVCTVEAMPLERPVDFLAIDEIQLAAHRERGHVFTDRLLHARGRLETWLLGADTMAPILRELVPGARLERRPRLSTLRHAGKSGLGGLPPRSALVAFSAAEVYELAARLRHRRGGAAVVLGALSPRTRNAQVALYEAREVQYVVATDAIGMGLNLDVDHVAFASVQKFDGREHRPLSAAEVGQIAGRAGRHQRDGTFGTLNPLPPFSERLWRRVEEHRFRPVERLVWRSGELDFGSLDGLLGSLAALPPSTRFSRVEQADDFDALRGLAERPSIRERTAGEEDVRLVWEVCQIPDYRKLLLLRHVSLLEEIAVALLSRGRLDDDWVDAHVHRLDRVDGEIDALTARLSAIRVWTYVSHRAGWTDPGLQVRTREVEDRIGDALHERLVERFVEQGRTSVVLERRLQVPRDGPFAQLGGLLDEARQADARDREREVDSVVEAPHDAFALDEEGVMRHAGEVVGRLMPGRELGAPLVRVELDPATGRGARSRVQRRLAAYAKDVVAELLAPIVAPAERPFVRGVLYQLERGLGTVDARETRAQVEAADEEDLAELRERGVELGRRTVFVRELLAPAALRVRALLVRLHRGMDAPRPPKNGGVSIRRAREVPNDAYLAAGWVPLGPRALRADIVERVLARLAELASPFSMPREVPRWLGVPSAERSRVLAALGYRQGEGGWRRV